MKCLAGLLMLVAFACAENSDFFCKYNRLGKAYRGDVAVTKEGLTCQRWDSQTPHSHNYIWQIKFPEPSVEEAENYCRNPNGAEDGPWCFTTDPDVEWQYCDIPYCQEETCKSTVHGQAYAGTLSVTKSGRTCQRWDSQTPHSHDKTDPMNFPDASLSDAANYCRSPDGHDLSSNEPLGPWCYTDDASQRWEYCDVPLCEVEPVNAGDDVECKMTGQGQTYHGFENMTTRGRECQRWDAQYPHQHTRNNAAMFPDASVEDASNYCRNPDDEPFGPWCYTTDPNVRWHYCGVEECTDEVCEDTFDMLVDSHSEGGWAYPQYDDGENAGLCLAGCLEVPECDAVDYHHGDNIWQNSRCWFHIVKQLRERASNGVDHYIRDGCYDHDCQETFTVTPNWQAEFGTQDAAMTVDECKASCLAEGDDCIGFDFDTKSNPWQGIRCWMHINIVIVPEIDTDHYPRIRC